MAFLKMKTALYDAKLLGLCTHSFPLCWTMIIHSISQSFGDWFPLGRMKIWTHLARGKPYISWEPRPNHLLKSRFLCSKARLPSNCHRYLIENNWTCSSLNSTGAVTTTQQDSWQLTQTKAHLISFSLCYLLLILTWKERCKIIYPA